MKFPVSELPVRVYGSREFNPRDNPKYERSVYLSDGKHHDLRDVSLKATYKHPGGDLENIEALTKRLQNQGNEMNRLIRRLGNPPAGVVAIGDSSLYDTILEYSFVSPPFIVCPMDFLLYVLEKRP